MILCDTQILQESHDTSAQTDTPSTLFKSKRHCMYYTLHLSFLKEKTVKIWQVTIL